MTAQRIVAKLWDYCNVLRDNGRSYGDYVDQLTYLLFLKQGVRQARHHLPQGTEQDSRSGPVAASRRRAGDAVRDYGRFRPGMCCPP